MNKKFLVIGLGLLLAGFLALPAQGQAQTTDTAQLQALIQQLQAQVATLQTQINNRNQSAATSTYELRIGYSGSGTISGPGFVCVPDCSKYFPAGTFMNLVASPAPGWYFGGWQQGCDFISTSTICNVTMNSFRYVTAAFYNSPSPSASSTLTVTKTGTGSGLVWSSPAGINCGSDCYESYASGTLVWLYANANSGSVFGGWTGCSVASSTSVCSVSMNVNKTVTATFNQVVTPTTTLTVVLAGSGSGQVRGQGINCGAGNYDCSEVFSLGSSAQLSAGAAPGSKFVNWIGCDSASSTSCSVTMNTNRNVTATFNRAAVPILEASTITAMQQQLNDIRMKLEEISAKLRTSSY